ncbi:MAG: methyltransferase regulatory domain-containing protein [Desulfatibacillum sp.]|nr:methyltransferase regulatory domain-containing protein [Desulfatibacillum sp.]
MTQEIVQRTSYDDVPYESNPFPQTHPQRLAALASLFGVNPPDIHKCRVLEMGCASGGNIIPMAFHLPESEFVGVDLALEQVKVGREVISDLGLTNIKIENASILDIDQSWGKFDYIITHGVFSWVPPEVQEKMLAVASENLNDEGLAYFSYNVYPGWHMRGMIRHMMLYHTAQFEEQGRKVQQARALVDFLAKSVPTENNYYGLILKNEMDLLKKSKDYYLFHDHLEEENLPMYFHQFAESADKHGLQYLGESEFSTMLTSGFAKEVSDTLKRISKNIIQTEQYMDFVRNRMFRQTLLCKKGAAINRNISQDRLHNYSFATAAKPEEDKTDLSAETRITFKSPKGPSISTNRPLTKAALMALREVWPQAMTLDELVAASKKRLEEAGLKDQAAVADKQFKQVLAGDLLQGLTINLVEYYTWQADFVSEISKKPKVSPLAVKYARMNPRTVNQRHETVPLDAALVNIIPLVDGTRDKKALLEGMIALVKDGTLSIKQKGEPVTDPKALETTLKEVVKNSLKYLANNALLVA